MSYMCTMKDLLCLLMATAFLMTTNGQCPFNVENISITTCSRLIYSRPRIYVDFYKINRPCLCTVTSGFNGDLLVTAKTLTISSCNTNVVVNGSHTFGCPIPQGSSATFTLSLDQFIDVQAEYSPPSSPGTFYQCLEFQENGGNGGKVGVTCDVPSEAKTRSYTVSTTRKTSSPSTSTQTASTTTKTASTTTKTASTSTKTASTSTKTASTTTKTAPLTSTKITSPSTSTTTTTTQTASTTTKTASTSTTTKITAPLTSTKITSPSTSTTTTTTIKRSTPLSSYTVQPTESTSHFSNNINTDNSMSFVTTIAVPYSSSIESTQDDPKEMIYFIAGSVAGGVILLTGLMIFIMLRINRARKRRTKEENKKEDGAHTNEVFDYNNELTENPLYITSEPAEVTENTPGEQHELGLPNNRPIDPVSMYAAPNKNRNHHQMTNSGDVYAQMYK